MADDCAHCFYDTMDKLWSQQNILLFEPAGISFRALVKRMTARAASSSCQPSPSSSCSSREDRNRESSCQENRPARLNIVIGQPLFQLQPPPRKKIQSHHASPGAHTSPQATSRRRMPKNMRSHRSFSELENYELKGFMDLGFSFPREKLSPELMSMVPALQRLAEKRGDEEERNSNGEFIKRPYLSEAWLFSSHSSSQLNLKILGRSPQGAVMKKHLRYWARKVASSISSPP